MSLTVRISYAVDIEFHLHISSIFSALVVVDSLPFHVHVAFSFPLCHLSVLQPDVFSMDNAVPSLFDIQARLLTVTSCVQQ